MRSSKIKYLVLLGIAGLWAIQKQKKLKAITTESQDEPRTLASLVDELPPQNPPRQVPTAENPFPKSNPALVPTGAGPGG